jgi:transcriptional regulator of heat shock response
MTIDKETRRNRVLEAIVRAHIATAHPVGSGDIAKALGLSSATIRNVMAELEHMGYVKQPHTSAGRIPTDLGYRRYVDSMMSAADIRMEDIYASLRQYVYEKRFLEEVIEAASHAISETTRYTGIALTPNHKLYFDGTYHMLEQPEFREMEHALDFLRMIEEREEIVRMLSNDLASRGTKIRIGRENRHDQLRECTIVTATYTIDNHISGSVGVIGPMRMKYERIVPAVEQLAEFTSRILEEL